MRVQYNVKLDEKDLELIQKISSLRGEDSSDFIRVAIKKELARLGFLKKEEAKALEVIS